ncbi:PASTA domain-containing protein [bacterium]|nr:PASTA domain-containing protein [bacterium]
MNSNQGRRTLLVIALGFCVWSSLVGRLFFIQILHNREYCRKSKVQHRCELVLNARRGNIYDRDGTKLVFNLPVKSYYAVPQEIENPQRLGDMFGKFLNRPSQSIIRNFYKKGSFVWLTRKMGPVESELIESWSIPGVYALGEMERFYPGRSMGCQIIGFTDVDNSGLEGLELQFDEQLCGEDGWAVVQMDACGRKIPLAEYPREEPCDGHSLVLTIQATYQAIAEQELERGIQDTRARAGCVILMDPVTGEILAMANEPRYDLNHPGRVLPEWRRNRAITDMFEPGSTFKIVAAAAALQEETQKPEDIIYCEEGQIEVCGKIIHDVEEFGWLTFQRVIEKSSNVGVIKVARKLGEKIFFDYARAFGFGNLTGIQLPGEAKGLLAHPKTWSGMSLASMAIGHEVAVTPLQLVCAYASLANGGTLMKPLIVRYIVDGRGNVVRNFSPSPVRRVISPETAAVLRFFLAKVVESGTGKMARMKGLTVAGKTGTAYKLKENGSGFSSNKFVASFCGFFPAESPRLVGLVILDEPRSPHSGGRAAAPIFRRIAERILYLPKGPCADLCLMTSEPGDTSQMVVVPSLSGLDSSAAVHQLQQRGLVAELEGDGLRVYHQQPQTGLLVARGETVLVHLGDQRARGSEPSEIPHVVGLTMREAIRQLRQKELAVRVSGSGLVVRQTPKAGSSIGEGIVCHLECAPSGGGQSLMAVASSCYQGVSKP